MPYAGPSKGCMTCLTRKVKCDEGKPTCAKCAKSNRRCGGYRAMGDVIFRDNTESTKRRVQRKTDSQIIAFNEEASPSELRTVQNPLHAELVDEWAVACFFSDYVWTKKTYTFSLDFLPYEYGRASPGCCMYVATQAVALAHLGNKINDPSTRKLARSQYVSALSLTNAALGDANYAMQDETMMAVHLLILFENIVKSETQAPLLAWITHLGGATHLLSRRGPSQLQRDIGVAMFQIQVVKMIMYGMLNGTRLPEFFGQWVQDGSAGSVDASFSLMISISAVPGLLERAKTLLEISSSARQPPMAQLIPSLIRLVHDGIALDNRLTTGATAIAVAFEDPATNVSWISSNWGFFIASRIVLKRVLENCLISLQSWSKSSSIAHGLPTQQLIKQTRVTQAAMITELCQLIPQTLCLSSAFPNPPTSSINAPLAGYFMMFPLHVALHGTKQSTPKQTTWLKSILRHIARREGLQLAEVLVEEPFELLDRMERLEI